MIPEEYRQYRFKLNGMFEALSCPARRKVLENYVQGIDGPTEIAVNVGVSPPTVIYHLGKLREAGILVQHSCGCEDEVDGDAIMAVVHYVQNTLVPRYPGRHRSGGARQRLDDHRHTP